METYTRMFIDCLLKQSREPNYQKKQGDTLSLQDRLCTSKAILRENELLLIMDWNNTW